MPLYGVVTPTYTAYGQRAIDEGVYGAAVCDYVEVEAENKAKAKAAAVREMTDLGYKWVADQRGDKRSPFSGLRVIPLCKHSAEIGDCGECSLHGTLYQTATEESHE